MSDNRFQINQSEQNAKLFMRAKGRLPESYTEFSKWLLEFTAYQTEALRLVYEAYQAHMNACSCTFVIESPKASAK